MVELRRQELMKKEYDLLQRERDAKREALENLEKGDTAVVPLKKISFAAVKETITTEITMETHLVETQKESIQVEVVIDSKPHGEEHHEKPVEEHQEKSIGENQEDKPIEENHEKPIEEH